jgi:regulatory protein
VRQAPRHPKSCHERALGLLAVRPRSRRELERRLLQAGFETDDVHDVLSRLERVDLIDDEAFARQVAEHQFGPRRAGRRAVAGSLLQKGVAPELVARVVDAAPDDEEERALDIARSRLPRLASGDPAKAFGRLSGFLMRRGYDGSVAREAARKALGVSADG